MGPRDENGEGRRFHNEEFNSFYCLPKIMRVIKLTKLRWVGHVARMEESRSSFKVLSGIPTGKTLLGRPRHRWEDIVCMDTRNLVNSAQNRDYWRALVNAVLNPRVHKPWS